MTRRLPTNTIAAVALAWLVVLTPTAVASMDPTQPQPPAATPTHLSDPRPPIPSPAAVATALAALLASLALPFAAATAAGATLVALRVRARRRRTLARFWVLPSRVDEAPPEAVTALLKAWHEQLSERWWRRLAHGQPALTLEVHCTAGPSGPRVRLVLGCPPGLAHALAGPLNACYSDARLVPCDPPPAEATAALIRLRKRDRFVRRLAAPPLLGAPPVDALLATLGALEVPAVVQFAVSPAPAALERLARLLLRAREHQLGATRVRSHAGELELAGGEATQWTALWFADVRVGAPSWAHGHRIAGALAGASAENRLRERRIIGGRERHRDRLTRGLGSALPGVLTDVLSCAELAALYHVPSPALRTVGFERSSVPRAIAPPQVLRPANRFAALGRDDVGYVALHPSDLEKNLALIGQIGSGKTSVLVKTTERDAHDPDCCVIVIDPNSTGVAAHLSAIPEHRTVHVLDVAQPECGFNPLLASGEISKVADDLVEAFVDAHDTGEIMTSSRQFLGGAAEAVIGAYRLGALGHDPSLWDLYRVLLPDQQRFRSRLLDAIGSDRELLGAATLLGEDIPQGLRDIGSQYALRMSAPRNKLFQMRSRNVDRVLRHPNQLDLRRIIANREVLVVDGRMGSTGVAQTRVLVMFLLNLIFAELRRQLELEPEQRTRVALKLDEAHLVMGEHFATALSTLRAGGLEATACYQYSAQLTEPVVRAGAASLLGSRCVFQLSEPEDAEEATKLAMSAYASAVRPDPESRARIGITPDVIMHLPRHWAICSWQAQGARVPAFAMNTLPFAVDEERIAHHAAAQRARGGIVPDRLPHPFADVADGPTRDPLPEPELQAVDSADEDELAMLEALMRANGSPEPRAPAEPSPAEPPDATTVPEPVPLQTQRPVVDVTFTPQGPRATGSPQRTPSRARLAPPPPEPPSTGPGTPSRRSPATGRARSGSPVRSTAPATPPPPPAVAPAMAPGRPRRQPPPLPPTAATTTASAPADSATAVATAARPPAPREGHRAPTDEDRAALERMQAAVLEQARADAAAADSDPPADAAPAHAPSPPVNEASRGRAARGRRAPQRLTGPVPETYLEVQLEPTSLTWDESPIDPIDKTPAPDQRQLQSLSALHRLGPVLSSQLEREFYPGVSDRTVQRSLSAMRRAGWVRRFRLREPQGRGQPKYVYVLDRRGFDLARDTPGPRGPYIPNQARFVERRFESVLKPLHDLHANALVFALMRQMPHAARGWRGAGESVIVPPKRRPRGEPERPIRPDEVPLESPLRISGLQIDAFEQIKPDFTVEIALTGADRRRRRFDLLVELDRSGNPRSDSNQRKLLRYDALLVGWHTLVERYRTLGHSPIVVVACADEPTARRWATAADELLTGRVSRLGDADSEAAFHARKRIFFATELDLHCGRLQGYRVPRHPPDLRRRLDGARAGRQPAIELVTFIPERYLR